LPTSGPGFDSRRTHSFASIDSSEFCRLVFRLEFSSSAFSVSCCHSVILMSGEKQQTSKATSRFLAGIKAAAAFASKKTGEAVSHLKAPPSKITCKQCDSDVMVPEELFNWHCGACNTMNHWANKACRQCRAVKTASAAAPGGTNPTVLCTRCGETNPVPLSNAKKHTSTVVRVTKELAHKTSEFAKEKYAENKAIPESFHCEHCNSVLTNPNALPPAYTAEEEKGERPQATAIECSQCRRLTSIPATVAADKAREGKFVAVRSGSKVYFSAKKLAHADCPKCQSALKLKQDGTTNLMPYVTAVGETQYSIKCPKCAEKFSAAMAI
jgi:hypothetical protein